MPVATAPRRRPGALFGPMLVALTVSACAAGTAAEPSASPSPSASTMAILDQQAFIAAPAAFNVVPAFGAIWVGGNTAGTVTRIDPATNAATGTVKVSTFTSDVAATDDAIWVLDGDAEAVRKIDPATAKLTDVSIPIGDDGGDLQFVKGKLWHTTRDGEVLEIDPASGEIQRWTLPGSCGEGGCGLAVREDAGYAIDDSSLRRIDLATHEVTATNDTDVASGVFGVGDDDLYAGGPTGGVAILDPVTLQLRRAIGSDPVVAPDGGKWSLGLAGENGGVVADAARGLGPVRRRHGRARGRGLRDDHRLWRAVSRASSPARAGSRSRTGRCGSRTSARVPVDCRVATPACTDLRCPARRLSVEEGSSRRWPVDTRWSAPWPAITTRSPRSPVRRRTGCTGWLG